MYGKYFVLFAILFTGWFLRKINFIDDNWLINLWLEFTKIHNFLIFIFNIICSKCKTYILIAVIFY